MMQRLISGKNAIFGSADFASLQAEIIEQLIVERAKMLLTMMRNRTGTMPLLWPKACQAMENASEALFNQMPQ